MRETEKSMRDGERGSCAAVVVWAGVVCVASLAGCYKPLLTPDEPRSQYDRSEAIRDRRAPSYVTDEFGVRQPNLRGRLLGSE